MTEFLRRLNNADAQHQSHRGVWKKNYASKMCNLKLNKEKK